MAISRIFFFTLLLLCIDSASGNVTLSSKLSTNERNPLWLSSSGDFAFGFRQINNTNTFMLAIWYDKIPDKTIVWNANADEPAPTGSEVQLTENGLSLSNPQGGSIWRATPSESVSYGAMLDTGNFVLASSNSTYVWESFKNPTDTLLPTQNLDLDGKLLARFSENNYTKGRFELYFDNSYLLLSPIGWPIGTSESRYTNYFSLNTSSAPDANQTASQLVFSESADVYVEKGNGDKAQFGWNNSPLDTDSYYYRLTLDFYGVLTQYRYPKGSNGEQGWSIVRYVPNDICISIFNDLGSGSCGYNSYCSIENQMPTCQCPHGYSFIDPNNQYGGCQPDFSLGCGADDEASRERPEEVYEFKTLQNIDWPLGDYEKLTNYTQENCERTCLYDCMCAVAIFDVDGTCWKKRLPLSNGRVNVNGGQIPLIKTRISSLVNSDHEEGKKDKAKPILLGSLIGSLVINGVLLATVVLIVLLKPAKRGRGQASSLSETSLHSFTYEDLKEATNGFSEEVGRGSFGIVYKGNLKSGSNSVVAVKKLDRLAQEREREFKNELTAIGKTCHRNLVRLIGFCDEGIHRILVYEFMNNGSLADLLFGKSIPTWNQRVRFALGIARGLVYLHEECESPIIHCDIKPQNILIDEYFTAKISDFGLAKLLLSNQSRTNTMIRGTRGYVAPEWFKNVPVTAKVDVYSFGVMLLEIICCRRSVLPEFEEEKALLTDWVYDCYMEGRMEDLVSNDIEATADKAKLQKWVMIAIWCIQENQEIRPTMKIVMQMLEGVVEVLNPPPLSSFTITG